RRRAGDLREPRPHRDSAGGRPAGERSIEGTRLNPLRVTRWNVGRTRNYWRLGPQLRHASFDERLFPMKDSLINVDAALRAEADGLLGRTGLKDLLSRSGTVHVSGSYALRLMTWRDLDIYLETPGMTVSEFFALGSRIAALL